MAQIRQMQFDEKGSGVKGKAALERESQCLQRDPISSL